MAEKSIVIPEVVTNAEGKVLVPADITELLDRESERINSPEFIGEDPVQFPRRFSDLRDIEIVSLLSATIAWGNRKMICRNCEKMLEIMNDEPFTFVSSGAYNEIDPERNIHRTFFGTHMQQMLRGLDLVYKRYGSLDAFCAANKIGETETPSWEMVRALNALFDEANGTECSSRVLPRNLDATALKRINMALRWLVRDDGIVDMGVWKSIPKSKLFIPLDVHVGNTARALGLIDRKANDRRTVLELTDTLRTLRPDDPVVYDYALFGIGINSK